jgi:hypothetical protein
MVLARAQALLTSSPEGRTGYIHADLRDPSAILSDPVTRDVLNFSQPIALMLVAILHFIPDDDKPAEIIATLLDALPVLELVPPGVVLVSEWRRDASSLCPAPSEVNCYGGVARKP